MEKTGKKVLIVGQSACEYSLAKKMLELDEVAEIFVTPGNDAVKEFATAIDIRESNIQELLEFVLENAIDFTVATSEEAIRADIASIFQENNQMIFAPTKMSANIALSKSVGKKFMYKTRIPVPKFGIFDKSNMAIDYAKKSVMPIVVKTDKHQKEGVFICNSFPMAKNFIESLFDTGEKRIIIEDYILGHEFSFYVITDGYQALPLGIVANYKHGLDGDGGALTSGMGAFTPDYKISKEIEDKILGQIVFPALDTLAKQQMPYVGILGIDLILNDREQFYAIEFNSFLKNPDCQVILPTIRENIYKLFEACVIGSFADDYEKIDISDDAVASCVLYARKEDSVIYGLEDLDDETIISHFNTRKNKYLEYETLGDQTIAITRKAKVLSKAVDDLYDEISVINFDGMKYRKDIGKTILK